MATHISEHLGALLAGPQEPATKERRSATINWEFNTFGEAKLTELVAECQRFCDDIKSGETPRWLSLLGVSGTGKSHMAKKMFRWVADHGAVYKHETGANMWHRCKRVDWRKAASNIRRGDWDYVEDLQTEWCLFIDDIGAEHQGGTGVVHSALETVLDARMGKWTIITANKTRQQISDDIDPRIASRMKRAGNAVVLLKDVKDYHERK